MATTKEVVLSGWLSEEEWDAEAATIIEDDEAYFVEDLTEGEASSTSVKEEQENEEELEEEWDAEGGFSVEVSDPNTFEGLIVFGYDSDEDWEAPSDEEEDIKDEKMKPNLHDDDKPQEYGEERHRASVIHEDLEKYDKKKKILEGRRCEDIRYDNTSPANIVLPSYKEASRGKTSRRVKKKEEMHGCIKSMENPKTKTNELKKEKTTSRGQVKKKIRNGRAQKIQGQRHAMVRPPETSMH